MNNELTKLLHEIANTLSKDEKSDMAVDESKNLLKTIARVQYLSKELLSEIDKLKDDTALSLALLTSIETFYFPSSFQVGRFRFSASTAGSIEFSLSENCAYLIGGKAAKGNGGITAELTPDDFIYEEDTDAYYVYLVTDKKVTVTSTVPFEVL